MDSEEEHAAAVVVYILQKKKKRKKRKKLSTWVKSWLTQRDALAFYNTLQLTTFCTHFTTSHKHLSFLQRGHT